MVIILFGGSGSLGFPTALFLKEAKYDVIIADIKKPNDLDLKFIKCDLNYLKEIENVFKKIELKDKVFGVINLVGKIENRPFYTPLGSEKYISDTYWDNLFSVNLKTALNLAKVYHEYVVRNSLKCNLINFSSTTSIGNAGQIAYSVSKSAIESLTRNLAIELGPRGHRFNTLSPGFIDVNSTQLNMSDIKQRETKSKITLRRFGDVKSIASAAKFVLENNYLNGQNIKIDGGFF